MRTIISPPHGLDASGLTMDYLRGKLMP